MRRLAMLLLLAGCGDNDPIVQGQIGACVAYWQYGHEMAACGPACSVHADCGTGCCYPIEDGGACIDVAFCDHARANGHDL